MSADLEAARQRGPLQIVGFKMPEEMGDAPVIVLRNVSTKATRSFWFTVRIGCANPSNKLESGPPVAELGPWKNPQDPQWPKESTIAPGAQGDAHITGLNGHHLVFSGRSAGCSCLRAIVRVAAVEFADGSNWELARATNADPEPINGVTDENLQPCQESPESAKVLKDLVGGGFKAGASGQHDGTPFRAYSMICTLQERGDGTWRAGSFVLF